MKTETHYFISELNGEKYFHKSENGKQMRSNISTLAVDRRAHRLQGFCFSNRIKNADQLRQQCEVSSSQTRPRPNTLKEKIGKMRTAASYEREQNVKRYSRKRNGDISARKEFRDGILFTEKRNRGRHVKKRKMPICDPAQAHVDQT